MKVKFDDSSFMRDMNNLVEYSMGFLSGVQKGKKAFLDNLGANTVEVLKNYIDTNARMNPEALHHIYEWYQVGSPAARLYDIDYTVSNLGLSLKSTFRQSTSVSNGSNEPFYDKARIMEQGVPITIRPKTAGGVLTFDDNGQQVFTKKPITITNPGGDAVQGAYENVFDEFFNVYFSQAFLKSSGIINYLKNPTVYKSNFAAGKRGGRSLGESVGYRWIANAGVLN